MRYRIASAHPTRVRIAPRRALASSDHPRTICHAGLESPVGYLEANRDDYISALRDLGESEGAWNRWISFSSRH
jgi:hypothetical protein